MKFVCYRHWEQLPDNANALFEQYEKDSLFYSRIWFECLTAHTQDKQQSLIIACVINDENVFAVLPMLMCAQNSLSALSNNFTSLFSVLVSRNAPQDKILTCLAEGLSRLPIHPLRFEPVDIHDTNISSLVHALQLYGFRCSPYFRFYNWSHSLNGQSFNEYMAERPGSLRNTIQRKQRKLDREHGYKIQLYKDSDIKQALSDYQITYNASWKSGEFFSSFTPALAQNLSRFGWTRLAILYVNHEPIAAQIWFIVHGKANIYRLVYDEQWKQYSPGSILTHFLMRYVIETDKVSHIDFLTGNEGYKQDWMSIRKERIGIALAKSPVKNNVFTRSTQFLKKLFSRSKKNVLANMQ